VSTERSAAFAEWADTTEEETLSVEVDAGIDWARNVVERRRVVVVARSVTLYLQPSKVEPSLQQGW
jgi:hypothetical protein